jgi:hypothetical protein
VLKIDTLESVYSNDPKIITDSQDVAPFWALSFLQILKKKNVLCVVIIQAICLENQQSEHDSFEVGRSDLAHQTGRP